MRHVYQEILRSISERDNVRRSFTFFLMFRMSSYKFEERLNIVTLDLIKPNVRHEPIVLEKKPWSHFTISCYSETSE